MPTAPRPLPPAHDHPVHDNGIQSYVLFDRLEAWNADGGTGLEWEGQAWIGTDLNRLWLRSEGERIDGRTESADLEVLYGHSFSPWWDVVTGIRHDFTPGRIAGFRRDRRDGPGAVQVRGRRLPRTSASPAKPQRASKSNTKPC